MQRLFYIWKVIEFELKHETQSYVTPCEVMQPIDMVPCCSLNRSLRLQRLPQCKGTFVP